MCWKLSVSKVVTEVLQELSTVVCVCASSFCVFVAVLFLVCECAEELVESSISLDAGDVESLAKLCCTAAIC